MDPTQNHLFYDTIYKTWYKTHFLYKKILCEFPFAQIFYVH